MFTYWHSSISLKRCLKPFRGKPNHKPSPEKMALKRKRVTADDILRFQEQVSELSSQQKPQEILDIDSEDDESSGSGRDEDIPLLLDSVVRLSRLEGIPLERQHSDNIIPENVPRTFSSLGISPSLITALAAMSIKLPTEIQAACIPPLLSGRVIIAMILERVRN